MQLRSVMVLVSALLSGGCVNMYVDATGPDAVPVSVSNQSRSAWVILATWTDAKKCQGRQNLGVDLGNGKKAVQLEAGRTGVYYLPPEQPFAQGFITIVPNTGGITYYKTCQVAAVFTPSKGNQYAVNFDARADGCYVEVSAAPKGAPSADLTAVPFRLVRWEAPSLFSPNGGCLD